MTTKPSNAPWADEPYKLITTPSQYRDIHSHSSVLCASDMAHVHNCLLRALNSILLQAPHIAASNQPAYNPKDVKDLLFYVESWVKTVHHHHHTEETVVFPAIEKMTGQPGLLSGPVHQHEAFHDPLVRLEAYAAAHQAKPAEYRWERMKAILDEMCPPLVEHLYEEVELFLTFDRFDDAGLRECWRVGEEAAKAQGKISVLYDIFPCVLGSCDKTYEGGNEFPPLPGFMPYAIKYWFGTYNRGAWRFNCSDFWGQPRPLLMLPENREGGTS